MTRGEPPHSLRQRLHDVFMPDYNRSAAVYWWVMLAVGGAAVAYALWRVQGLPWSVIVQIAVGTGFAVVAGFFPVRIPGSKNSFVAGEVFIFLLLLMHGVEAATIAAAGEAFVGAVRSSKRWTSRIISPALSALAMLSAGSLVLPAFALLGAFGGKVEPTPLLVLASSIVLAGTYFVFNTVLVALLFSFKGNRRFHWGEHLSNFGAIGVAYAGSAVASALLHLTVQHSGMGVLLGALPVVALMMATVHYFVRQQEAIQAVQRNRTEAAEREAEQTARHLEALSASEQRFHSAFTHASIGMALVSYEGHILQANAALALIVGEPDAAALQNRSITSLVVESDRDSFARSFERVGLQSLETSSMEMRCRHAGGSEIWVAVHCATFTDAGSAAPCLIVQVQDISARRHAEAQLNHIAFHDSLTGLPNRNRYHLLLAQALAAAQNDPQRHFAVLFLDFDRFKLINDSMGHSAGDELLIQVSRRIQDEVRPGDVVARLGGDEFALLLHHVNSPSGATRVASRLLLSLSQPLMVSGVSVTTSASIGITFSELGYQTPEELLRDADIAMYRAKANGKARYAIFDATLHADVANRVQLEADLRRAIDNREIDVAYQPLFHIGTGRLRGFEALARWNHPTRGAISPVTFIPIAEESGLIIELSDHVLVTACAEVRRWQEQDPALGDLKLQVNISGADLAHTSLFQRVERVLRATGFTPQLLTLELTENILMQRVEGAISTLDSLRRLGVRLAIDDFGTGYSSLSYLSTLPIDSLKIDRSFVHGMSAGSKDTEIVRAIVSLGGTLGKTVVAEGIESQAQLVQLHGLGCEHGQGFHLSRPLSPGEVDALLKSLTALEHGRQMRVYDTTLAPLLHH